MCYHKSAGILFALALVLCLAQAGYSQSPVENIIDSLTTYQIRLASAQKQMRDSLIEIENSKKQITALQKELEDSKNNSQTIIDGLRKDLETSRTRLAEQERDLSQQTEALKTLSEDSKALRNWSAISDSIRNVAVFVVIAETLYIVADKFVIPLFRK
jgi:DNA repair exonuclease SbcCD ATPase subunit